MKDWIPFLQALIWPVFIVVTLLVFRKAFADVVLAIKRRIEAGAEMAVGPAGITIGSAPVLKSEETTKKASSLRDNLGDRSYLSTALYMVHNAKFAKLVPEGRDYEIKVRVYAESAELEDRIERVEYHLHRSYSRRIRESRDKENAFQVTLYAWGQFNLKAHVYIKEIEEPVVLWRFLNF